MDALSTYFVEETFCTRSREEEEEIDEEEEGRDDEEDEETCESQPEESPWAPGLLCKTDKEVYYYAEILTPEASDSMPPEAKRGLKYRDSRERGRRGTEPTMKRGTTRKSNDDDTESEGREDKTGENEAERDEETEKIVAVIDEKDRPKNGCNDDVSGQMLEKQTAAQQVRPPAWTPSVIYSLGKDIYHYAGEDIIIYESIDSFGAVMWPAALALCSFLDRNREEVNLQGKKVLELGAGTGLVTIVATLLGAEVTATDLPDVLSNLRANVMRNTRGRCRHLPQVAVLSWSHDLEHTYPTSLYRYDYVLAADVVYHHDFLAELLATMKHFCGPGTTMIWANRVRMETDRTFTENFKRTFRTSLLAEDGDMKIFMATCREADAQEEWLDH